MIQGITWGMSRPTALYLQYTVITLEFCSHSFSWEKKSQSEVNQRASHSHTLSSCCWSAVLLVFSSTKLGKWGRVTCRCRASSAFYPSPPVPLILLQMGLLLLLFSLPLSCTLTQPLVPSTQRTDQSQRERKGCREETVLLIKHWTEAEGRLSRQNTEFCSHAWGTTVRR